MAKVNIGIDPGATGGIAILWEDGRASVYGLTASYQDNVEVLREVWAELYERSIMADNTRVMIEDVHAMPKQGVSSTFTFGKGYGALLGALYAMGFPVETVSASAWKKAVFKGRQTGLDRKAQKTLARDTARSLYPALSSSLSRVADDGKAEALLIARYAQMTP